MKIFLAFGIVILGISVIGFLFYWVVYPELGICGRTPEIRNEIVENLPSIMWCGQVNSEQLETITTLPLHFKRIDALKSGDFDDLHNLNYLHLDGNDLVSLPEGIFDNNPNLERLTIKDNDLVSLPEGIFDNNPNLQAIDLSYNDLVSLPEDIFENLPKLQYLVTTSNGFDCIPRNTFGSRTDDYSELVWADFFSHQMKIALCS